MRFSVLALDYDGTIARGGVLDPAVGAAIAEVRAQGITVVIVRGRVLSDLRHRELEVPLVLLFNRSRLMVLPQSVSKATGLRAALSALRLSAHNAIAIGDAENDHELRLLICPECLSRKSGNISTPCYRCWLLTVERQDCHTVSPSMKHAIFFRNPTFIGCWIWSWVRIPL